MEDHRSFVLGGGAKLTPGSISRLFFSLFRFGLLRYFQKAGPLSLALPSSQLPRALHGPQRLTVAVKSPALLITTSSPVPTRRPYCPLVAVISP